MSRVRIREEQDLSWFYLRDFLSPEEQKRFSEGELISRTRIREEGTDNSPQLFEVEFPPNSGVEIHAHEEDEIVFVLAGQMHVGGRVLGPGSSMFIQGNTLYSFKAGEQGVTFLNFRPRKDTTYVTRDEFMAQRKQGHRPSEALGPEAG